MLFKSFAFWALLLAAAGPLAAGDTIAVLSSVSGIYVEAFSAFQAGYGAEISYFDISKEKLIIPPGTRTVVAFGSKAAGHHYPPGVDLVYSVAPGFVADARERTGATVKISMLAAPEVFIARLKELQPSLKRLRIFWRSPAYAVLYKEYTVAAAAVGVEISAVRVEREDQLPGLLRAALGRADAFWLPPDPLLISQETLMIFKHFSQNNSMPMYVSTKGLAQKGACASIGISFAQAGAAAAAAAKKLREGRPLPPIIYEENTQLTINASAAKRCGLIFEPVVIGKADYVFP